MAAELYYGRGYDRSKVPQMPLANPWFAGDLSGLPRHAISVNELDPLRDEGLAYCKRLAKAGNKCYSRVVRGTPHTADMIAMKAMPGLVRETLCDIVGFAQNLRADT